MAKLTYSLAMYTLPQEIYLTQQVRELDRIAIEEFKVASFSLMKRAGVAAFKVIQQDWPMAEHLLVLVGTGNNGGDGYIIANLAWLANKQVTVIQVGDHSKLMGDAKKAYDEYIENGGVCSIFDAQSLPSCDLIVDALLGSGLARPVKGEFEAVIRLINEHAAPVLSADIPSGLDANRGIPLGIAVIANVTVTFVGMKLGLVIGTGRNYSGKVIFNNLQIPNEVYALMSATCHNIKLAELHSLLGKRNADAHKGDFGHVLVIGGNAGMAGSVMLAAEAAARTGCGLVSVATISQHVGAALATCREMMVAGVEDVRDLDPLLKRATVVAVGPGLGQNQWAKNLFARIIEFDLPMVVDADALNLLAKDPLRKPSWVLTPHSGEAARLLKTTTHEIQQQRLESAQAIQQQYGGVCVLKGSGTLVASPDQISICTAGNPGMASGGMGDVLTGIIAGLLAQGLALNDAARFGVQLHAQSADLAAQDGMRGMLASDLFSPLRKLVNAS